MTCAMGVTLAMLALPSGASAAVLAPLKPCYVAVPNATRDVETIAIRGGAFTPNARVDVAVDGSIAVSGVPVDAAGNLPAGVEVRAPFLARGDRAFAVVVTERGNPANVVTATSRITALSASFSPSAGRPGRKVTFRGRGFTLAGRVYLHYRHKGKTRRRVSVKPTGPCGRFEVRRRLFPFSPVATGRWVIQFDQQKKFSATPRSAFVEQSITVTRTVRFR
jgi:hypothetical protein